MVILFMYVHINDQLKKSEDLEIYEMDYVSNEHLQSICNVKQPVLFELHVPEFTERISKAFTKSDNIDIKVWDSSDYSCKTNVSYILLPFSSACGLFKTDPKSHYFTERNQEFLEETDFLSDIRDLDPLLKPRFTAYSNYEYIAGSEGTATPLRYHTGDRKFIYVTSGKISVKMTPWRSKKYLDPIADYENYEFFSQMNPWSSEPDPMLRFLEFEVLAGYVLYIPPYWWYSYKFYSADSTAVGIEYKTMMNLCAHSIDIGRYYLQFHNTKTVPVRTLQLESVDKLTDDEQSKPSI
jgi:hypothetical protein